MINQEQEKNLQEQIKKLWQNFEPCYNSKMHSFYG